MAVEQITNLGLCLGLLQVLVELDVGLVVGSALALEWFVFLSFADVIVLQQIAAKFSAHFVLVLFVEKIAASVFVLTEPAHYLGGLDHILCECVHTD